MKQAARKAKQQCGCTQPSAAAPLPRARRVPAVRSTVNMPPRAASSSSVKRAVAASLDCYDEEEGSFHQFHAHQVQPGESKRGEGSTPVSGGA